MKFQTAHIKGKARLLWLEMFREMQSNTPPPQQQFYLGNIDVSAAEEACTTQRTVLQLLRPLTGKYHRVIIENNHMDLSTTKWCKAYHNPLLLSFLAFQKIE